ncbi:hypothetical protein D0T85_09795 [Bacteroides sp. 519]|nr:hypothetical protein [Bacteroides sp. 519]
MRKQILALVVILSSLWLSSCGDDPMDYYDQNVDQLTNYVYKEYTWGEAQQVPGATDKWFKPLKAVTVYSFNKENVGNIEWFAPFANNDFFGSNENSKFTWDLTGKNYQNLIIDAKNDIEFNDISFSYEAMSYSDGDSKQQLLKELIPGTPLFADGLTYWVENLVTSKYSLLVDYIYLSPVLLTIKTPSGMMRKYPSVRPLTGEYKPIETTEDFYIYIITDDQNSIYSYTFTSELMKFKPNDGRYYFYVGKYSPQTKDLETIENKKEYKVQN